MLRWIWYLWIFQGIYWSHCKKVKIYCIFWRTIWLCFTIKFHLKAFSYFIPKYLISDLTYNFQLIDLSWQMPASLWRAATQVVLKSNYWYVAITSKAIVKYFFRKIEVSYLFWLFLQNIRIYNINALPNIHCAFYPQTHDLWIEYLLEKKYLIWSLDTFEKSHTVQTLSTLTFCG